MYEIKEEKIQSVFSFWYNRISYKEMICTTLKNNYTILPTPFSSVSHTYKPNKIFSSYSLQYIFSFLLISFSFSWNVHWVLSLSSIEWMFTVRSWKKSSCVGFLEMIYNICNHWESKEFRTRISHSTEFLSIFTNVMWAKRSQYSIAFILFIWYESNISNQANLDIYISKL